MKKVVEKAPCRIDFSGGTLDLWPLYLYQGSNVVVHMAIDLKATAEVSFKRSRQTKIHIHSEDLNLSSSFNSVEELERSLSLSTRRNSLRWVNRLCCYYLKEYAHSKSFHLEVNTRSDIPPGSGLGGSSVLGVALSKALIKALGPEKTRISLWKLQEVTRDLEAIEIEHPAGDQDYVPALFKGLLLFEQGPGRKEIHRIEPSLGKRIASRSALVYTGRPHHSGINNWQIFKEFHEKNKVIHRYLEKIGKLSLSVANSLLKGDEESFYRLVNEEWKTRQKLGDCVNAPELESAWRLAKKQGAIARKGCGAGGGGCLWVAFSDSKKRDQFVETQSFPGGKLYKVKLSS